MRPRTVSLSHAHELTEGSCRRSSARCHLRALFQDHSPCLQVPSGCQPSACMASVGIPRVGTARAAAGVRESEAGSDRVQPSSSSSAVFNGAMGSVGIPGVGTARAAARVRGSDTGSDRVHPSSACFLSKSTSHCAKPRPAPTITADVDVARTIIHAQGGKKLHAHWNCCIPTPSSSLRSKSSLSLH